MKELTNLKNEEVDTVSITPNNKEVHIIYKNKKNLIIGLSTDENIIYAIVDSKMQILEKGIVFERELATLLNFETTKAIDNITLDVFKMKTDYKKTTIISLVSLNTPQIVLDMLSFLTDLHIFFGKRMN